MENDKKWIKNLLDKVWAFNRSHDFMGYDPFDALNSPILKAMGFGYNKISRIIAIQFLKRSHVNLRPILKISEGLNPKGSGLFLSGLVLIEKQNRWGKKNEIKKFVKQLLSVSSLSQYNKHCWGYNFDWQSRTFFLPAYTPNVVTTTYVSEAFLRLYKLTDEEYYLNIARSACNFILEDLNRSSDGDSICFSYSPLDHSQVFNASLLGARLLIEVSEITNEEVLRNTARRSVEFAVKHQKNNGSWHYGCDSNQKWIDSLHTGYNLESLYICMERGNLDFLKKSFDLGFEYYNTNLFEKDGSPKYFNNKTYPIDSHTVAQAIILYSITGNNERAMELVKWTIDNLWSEEGYFYYQKNKYWTNKIKYMRWSQAWMTYALCTLYSQQWLNK